MEQSIRPNSVNSAVKLLYLGLMVSVINAAIHLVKIAQGKIHVDLPSHLPMHHFLLFISSGIFVALLIQYAFIRWIGSGQNWARIMYLLLYSIGLYIIVIRHHEIMAAGMTYYIPTMINTVIGFIACCLIFTRSATPWFHQ
jgi:hypothetical protein